MCPLLGGSVFEAGIEVTKDPVIAARAAAAAAAALRPNLAKNLV